MTTMQKIIDKLASKELSFGCLGYVPQNYNIVGDMVYFSPAIVSETWYSNNGGNRVGYLSPMDENGFRGKHHCKREDFKILGHPVYIGDVLEKVWKNEGEKISFEDVQKNIKKLLYLWSACKFTRSLQEIAECGYEAIGNEIMDEKTGVYYIKKRLKDPNAQALADFINSII